MGAGIALVAAKAGFEVEVVEPDSVSQQRALAAFARDGADAATLARVRWTGALPEHIDAVLAIEAVPERYDLKSEVIRALSAALPPEAVLATNTSSLSVEELADLAADPERVVGMHFFNPPAKMVLVEVVQAPQSAEDAVDRALELAERMGKTPVLTADTPGFIVNRVARPYYLQAMRALERGVGPVPELDALARAAGFRMGPFELMDLIGLDVNLATSESVFERTDAARLEPVATQRQMVADGLLGRKSGAGFYAYADGKHARFEPAIAVNEGPPNEDEVVAVIGFGNRAEEIAELVEERYKNLYRIDNQELLDELPADVTIAIEAGDGADDRCDVVAQLDTLLPAECVIFADAYVTDLAACAQRMRHPNRLVGYGVLGALEAQSAVEIVDRDDLSDDALELAQELFAEFGKASILVEDEPGLFLGRVVGSIVNEAMIAVAEGIATPEDVDLAMRLGANYPIGPIAWGREIGGARIRRILKRLADAEGERFAAHRSLWLLDVEEAPPAGEAAPEESAT